jgi:exopolysaccharide production protein ExoZ
MRENIAAIQFLRFVAAALVVLFPSIAAANKHFAGSMSESSMYAAGFASGVHIFFVIGGFIMMYTSFEKNEESLCT